MEVVAVTGGLGLIGRFVVKKLIDSENIKEVRILDKKATNHTGRHGDVVVRSLCVDVSDACGVERGLLGCTSVVHCARPSMPLTYQNEKQLKDMWRNTLQATEVLIDEMLRQNIRRLVFVGDAYSALPIEDNYGLGEEMFRELPPHYLLGEYGEACMRSEMYARNAVKNSSGALNGIFLRPLHIIGEGRSSFLEDLATLAKEGQLPYIEGHRRGMHQFIYAGNLAIIIHKALVGLATNAKKFSGEIVYCMDETNVKPIRELIEKLASNEKYSKKASVKFPAAWFEQYYTYLKYGMGFEVPSSHLSYPAFRMLFEKTVGYGNKKLRLLMDYIPEVPLEKALDLTVAEVKFSQANQKRPSVRSG